MTKRERLQLEMDVYFHLILAGLAYRLVDAKFMAFGVICFSAVRLIQGVFLWHKELLREESEQEKKP